MTETPTRTETQLPDWIGSVFATAAPTEDDHLLTADETAEHLRLTVRTTLDLLRSGAIPAAKVGGQWRVSKSALDAFLNKPRGPLPYVIVTRAVDSDDILVIGPSGVGKSAVARSCGRSTRT